MLEDHERGAGEETGLSQASGVEGFSQEPGPSSCPSAHHSRARATWFHRVAPSALPHTSLMTQDPPELSQALGSCLCDGLPHWPLTLQEELCQEDPGAQHRASITEGPDFC